MIFFIDFPCEISLETVDFIHMIGEELTSVIGSLLRPTDAMALHYRHLAAQICRQLNAGRTVEEVHFH